MFNNLNHFKSVIAHKFFVEPADCNYYFARWAVITGFYPEFYWQAAQAVEKYLKAALVLNGISVNTTNHRLVDLFSKYASEFGELSLSELKKPAKLPEEIWENEPVSFFVARIAKYGDPNVRYGQISWFNRRSDIFKLDELIFRLRRTTIGKGWIIGENWEPVGIECEYHGRPYFDLLANNDKYQPRAKINIRNMSSSIAGEKIEDALYAWNFCLDRDDSDLQKPAPSSFTSQIGSGANSYIFLLYEYINNHEKPEPYIQDGIVWMIDNIKLEKSIRRAFLEITQKHKH